MTNIVSQGGYRVARIARAYAFDTVLATTILSFFVDRLAGADLSMNYHLSLVFAVVAVYVTDHIIDLYLLSRPMQMTDTLRSHRSPRYLPWIHGILVALISAGLASATAYVLEDDTVLLLGVVLGCLSALYLTMVASAIISPELKLLTQSILFCAGICWLPLMRTAEAGLASTLFVFCFFVAILVNLLTCSLLDAGEDAESGLVSIAHRYSPEALENSIILCWLVVFSVSVMLACTWRSETILLSIPATLQLGTLRLSRNLNDSDRMAALRLMVDLSFTPLLLVLWW